MTRYDGSRVYSYNMMLGVFQSAANAACAADPARCLAVGASGNAIPISRRPQGGGTASANFAGPGGTSWLPPPQIGVGTRYTGQAPAAYNPATHTTNYPEGFIGAQTSNYRTALVPNVNFGPGQVGKWQTKSDSMEDGITADLQYTTLTAQWDITDNLNFEAILSNWEQDATPGHRLRRHGVLGDHGRLEHRAPERHDGVPSVGHGAQRADQLARRLLLARRGNQEPCRSLGHVRVGYSRLPNHRQRRFRAAADQRGGCRVRAANRDAARSERPASAGFDHSGQPRRCAVRRNHADGRDHDRGRRRRREPLPVAVHEHQHRQLDGRLGRRRGLVRRGHVLGHREARPHRGCAPQRQERRARDLSTARRVPHAGSRGQVAGRPVRWKAGHAVRRPRDTVRSTPTNSRRRTNSTPT